MRSISTPFEGLSDGETALLGFFLVVATYMFVEAGSYSDTIGLYPRLLSGVVIGCSLLLLFRAYLPASVRAYVAETDGAISPPGETVEDIEAVGETGGDVEAVGETGNRVDAVGETDDEGADPPTTSRAQVRLVVLIAGYLLVSYLVGMYFATPVFVLVYGRAFGLGHRETVALAAVSLGVAHVFLVVFNAPIGSGVLV